MTPWHQLAARSGLILEQGAPGCYRLYVDDRAVVAVEVARPEDLASHVSRAAVRHPDALEVAVYKATPTREGEAHSLVRVVTFRLKREAA